MNPPKNFAELFLILLILALAGCQRESENQDQLSPTPKLSVELSPTEPISNDSSVEESKVQTESANTPTPEASPTAPLVDFEETNESSDEVNDSENEDICGQILPLISPSSTPEAVSFPAVQLADTDIPTEVWPALQRLLDAPETVGLAAFEIGRESEGIFINPDEPMPLASVVKVINLIAYAEAVEAGVFDPSSWVELDDLNRAYLPRVDLGAHADALEELQERTLIAGDPPAAPLEEVPGMMIRHSSNAAADFIHLDIGQTQLENTIKQLGLDSHTAPCPWIGQFLVLANHERVGSHRTAVENYIANPSLYAEDVMALTAKFVDDQEFRNEEIAWRRRQPSFDVWRLFGENLNAKASAGDYAQLLRQILQNQLSSPYVNLLVRRAMEWPVDISENQDDFSILGYKGGSLPGILTSAYYGQRQSDGRQVVVVLFFRELPRNTYRSWLSDLSHDKLARWLLSDEQAIDYLGQLLGLK